MLKRNLTVGFLLVSFILLTTFQISAQKDPGYVKAHFSKKEYRIQMRDGAKLFTAVYSPLDTSVKYPILLARTPYTVSPYGEDKFPQKIGPSDKLMKDGYIFVYQDVRGMFMSEGDFVDVRPYKPEKNRMSDIDESSDAYDTIEWLILNLKNHNGNVGMWGISYPGFYAAMGAIDAHPSLKAVSPQAPIADWFIGDDFRHNGTLFISHAFDFISGFGKPRPGLTTSWQKGFHYGTPDGFRFFLDMGAIKNANDKLLEHKIPFWNDIAAHPDYDEFWQARNTLPHFKNIKPAVLVTGGLFDAEDLYGALNTYKSIKEKNPTIFTALVMGPWFHGGWARSPGDKLGNISFGFNTSEYYENDLEYSFFNHYLKGLGESPKPLVHMFNTGKNEWKSYRSWPPETVQKGSLALSAAGKLVLKGKEDAIITEGFDEFISDPTKPVPFTADVVIRMHREYMTEDQRFVYSRPDVMSYETPFLDSNITISGGILADLFVSTSSSDADWVVKVIDVFPGDTPDFKNDNITVKMGGYQMMVRSDVIRGKYRNSFSKPEPFIPNKVEEVKFNLQDINHTFLKGHKIMVQIQSSWFHLIDRNPQKFMNIFEASDSDYIKATHRIYFSKEYPSRLIVNFD